MMLRNALWWDGQQMDAPQIDDAVLYGGGVARLVAPLACCDQPVIAAIKAGHNAENHNQNDVGSFVVHVRRREPADRPRARAVQPLLLRRTAL